MKVTNSGRTVIRQHHYNDAKSTFFSCVHGALVIPYTTRGIHHWLLKISKLGNQECSVGINEANKKHLSGNHGAKPIIHYSYSSSGSIYKCVPISGRPLISTKYFEGDCTIDVILNMNNKTVVFGINNSELKGSLSINKTLCGYCLAVMFCSGSREINPSVTMLSYKYITAADMGCQRNYYEMKEGPSYDTEVVEQLITLEIGSKTECIQASKMVVNASDINAVTQKVYEINEIMHYEHMYAMNMIIGFLKHEKLSISELELETKDSKYVTLIKHIIISASSVPDYILNLFKSQCEEIEGTLDIDYDLLTNDYKPLLSMFASKIFGQHIFHIRFDVIMYLLRDANISTVIISNLPMLSQEQLNYILNYLVDDDNFNTNNYLLHDSVKKILLFGTFDVPECHTIMKINDGGWWMSNDTKNEIHIELKLDDCYETEKEEQKMQDTVISTSNDVYNEYYDDDRNFNDKDNEIYKLKLELKTKETEIFGKDERIKKLEQQILDLVASKENLLTNYNDEIQDVIDKWSSIATINNTKYTNNKSNDKTVAMIKELNDTIRDNTRTFNQEILQNKNDIHGLNESYIELKDDFEETKERFVESITSLNKRMDNMEELVLERDITMNKINNKIENLISTSTQTLQLQREINQICNDDENNELFYKTMAQKVAMMFFDAKVVISDFVDHVIASKNKAVKGIKLVSLIAEKLSNDIPFVSTIIGLIRTAANKTYDIFVLKSLAQNVLDFECLFGGDGSQFAVQFALNITKKCVDKIKDIKIKYKYITDRKKRQNKINKEMNKRVTNYSEDLIKMICTGYGETVYKIFSINNNLNNGYLDVLAYLTIHHPTTSVKKTKTDIQYAIDKENMLQFLETIKSSQAKEVIVSYFDKFGTPTFMDSVIKIAKEKLDQID